MNNNNIEKYSGFSKLHALFSSLIFCCISSVHANENLGCSFNVHGEWQNGAIAEIQVENSGDEPISVTQPVEAHFDNADITITSAWNGSFSGSDPYQLQLADWNNYIEPGAYASIWMELAFQDHLTIPELKGACFDPGIPPTAELEIVRVDGLQALFRAHISDQDDPEDELSVRWDFGDGTVEDGTTYSSKWHTYAADGSYVVTLTVSDGHNDTVTQVEVDVAADNVIKDPYCRTNGVPMEIECRSNPEQGREVLDVLWEFSDGATDTGINVFHRFADYGSYNVSMEIRYADGGIARGNTQFSVIGYYPEAAFTHQTHGMRVDVDASSSVIEDHRGDGYSFYWLFDYDNNSLPAEGAQASVLYGVPDTYQIRLTVRDDDLPGVASQDVEVGYIGTAEGLICELEGSRLTLTNTGATDISDWQITLGFADDTQVMSTGDTMVAGSRPFILASRSEQRYLAAGETLVIEDLLVGYVNSSSSGWNSSGSSSSGTISTPSTQTPVYGGMCDNPGQPNIAPDAAFECERTDNFSYACSAQRSTDPNGDSLTYVWDFGNGYSDTGVQVTYSYPEAGIFPITLTVSDGELQDTQAYAYRAAHYEASCTGGFQSIGCRIDGGVDGDWEREYIWTLLNDGYYQTGTNVSLRLPAWGGYTWGISLNVDENLPEEIDGVEVVTQGANYSFSVTDTASSSSSTSSSSSSSSSTSSSSSSSGSSSSSSGYSGSSSSSSSSSSGMPDL